MAGLSDILDPSNWGRLSTIQLVQEMAFLAYLNKNKPEDSELDLVQVISGARVANEIYQRLTSKEQIETYQQVCIMSIVAYIQKNPKASQEDLQKVVAEQIAIFKEKIEQLE